MRSPASEAPPPPDPRGLAMESISSKKRIHGAAPRACFSVSFSLVQFLRSLVSSRHAFLFDFYLFIIFILVILFGIIITLANRLRTLLSDSPIHMLSSSGPLTEMKLVFASFAIALAISVLPQPEGP
jgi:hypothetical protein